MNPLASLSRAMTPMRWRLAAGVAVILLSAAIMPGRRNKPRNTRRSRST